MGWPVQVRAALVLGPLLIGAVGSPAQSPVKQVLVLQTFARGNLTLDHFTAAFRVALDQRAGRPLNVVQVVVGPTGFVGARDEAVVDYIRAMYAGRQPPDLVMTVGGPAAVFARNNRRQLFPAATHLFAAMDQRYLRTAPLGDNEAAVPVSIDHPRLIDDILRVLPQTRQVFMVTGAGPVGRFMRPELDAGFERFRGRVTFVWSNEMSLPEILQRVANLPPHSAIVYQTLGTDAQGGTYTADQVVTAIHARANAPLFSAQSPYLGRGMVGGSMMDIDELARRTADVATRILDGEPPARLRVPPQVAGVPMFDWRELKRWNIPESRLPPGSVVRFRPPSLWDEHKVMVVMMLGALTLQSLLIALLLYERRARQRAEVDSRRNLSLAADANRRATMSALTTSIGHELGQPLSAIAHNAQALQMMVTAEKAVPHTTGEILADIQAEATLATRIIERHRVMLRTHQLQKQSIDLHAVIRDSLALLAHDLRARRIEAVLDLPATSCVVEGDPVLLGQVFVNLLRNAMDALTEVPPAERRTTIRSVVRAAEIAVSVSDTGRGLPAEIADTLFTAFVTTKSSGLGIGLAVTQRIVEAHGGTITARDNPAGGATFTVILPRDPTLRVGADESEVQSGAPIPAVDGH